MGAHTVDVSVPREELRDFLRTRRARLQPEDVGLAGGEARRVPGLRREEIARLAGVSVDYYVRLEQGRSRNVSASVLDAVARALQLDEPERRHLFDLAQPTAAPRRATPRRQRLRPAVVTLLEGMELQPAFVVGPRLDVLAANWIACQLIGDFQALPPRERNFARFLFLDEDARELYVDWPHVARESVATLRMYAGRHPDDPELSRLVGELSVKSREFAQWWSAHDVAERSYGTKTYRHPLVGDVTVSCESLRFPADPELMMCIYSAEPGSASEQALRMLAAMRPADPDADADAGGSAGPTFEPAPLP